MTAASRVAWDRVGRSTTAAAGSDVNRIYIIIGLPWSLVTLHAYYAGVIWSRSIKLKQQWETVYKCLQVALVIVS